MVFKRDSHKPDESLLKGIPREALSLFSVDNIYVAVHRGLAAGSRRQVSKVLRGEKQHARGNTRRLLRTQRKAGVQKKAKQEGFVCSGLKKDRCF